MHENLDHSKISHAIVRRGRAGDAQGDSLG